MGGPGFDAEHLLHPHEVADVLKLLDRLLGEEARGVDAGRVVQPLADLDAGDLTVQKLIQQPAEQCAIALRLELFAPEIERHLIAREQHCGSA
jgi:hypothetical protein